MNALRALNVIKNKHIPPEYLTASIEQRLQLLHGLMDTDGACNTRGTATFCSIHEQVARQVFDLSAGLGLRPRIGTYSIALDSPKAVNGRYHFWKVSFQAHADRNPFSMPRKIERAIHCKTHRSTRFVKSVTRVESVPTSCIQVEGGMYLAGRELVPTHNSTIGCVAGAIQEIINDPEITICILSNTTMSAVKNLMAIKSVLENNETLKTLYPEILYQTQTRKRRNGR